VNGTMTQKNTREGRAGRRSGRGGRVRLGRSTWPAWEPTSGKAVSGTGCPVAQVGGGAVVEEGTGAESSNRGTTVRNVPERGKVVTFEAHGSGARDSGCQGQRTGFRPVKDRPSHYRATRPRWSCAGQAAG